MLESRANRAGGEPGEPHARFLSPARDERIGDSEIGPTTTVQMRFPRFPCMLQPMDIAALSSGNLGSPEVPQVPARFPLGQQAGGDLVRPRRRGRRTSDRRPSAKPARMRRKYTYVTYVNIDRAMAGGLLLRLSAPPCAARAALQSGFFVAAQACVWPSRRTSSPRGSDTSRGSCRGS